MTTARRKRGFLVPTAEWDADEPRPTFESMVFRAGHEMKELIDFGEVRRIWAEHQEGLFDGCRQWQLAESLGVDPSALAECSD